MRTAMLLVHGTCLKEIVHDPGNSTKTAANQRQSIMKELNRYRIATLAVTHAVRQTLTSPTR